MGTRVVQNLPAILGTRVLPNPPGIWVGIESNTKLTRDLGTGTRVVKNLPAGTG